MINNLIEIIEHKEKSFKIVTEFEGFKTAIMNDMEKYLPQNICKMQKHNLTDEIFVLLEGKCILFVADGDENPGNITAVNMEPLKVYNIKKGVWHTHAFARNTKVFIVEHSNTNDENSPCNRELTKEQIMFIRQEGASLN